MLPKYQARTEKFQRLSSMKEILYMFVWIPRAAILLEIK